MVLKRKLRVLILIGSQWEERMTLDLTWASETSKLAPVTYFLQQDHIYSNKAISPNVITFSQCMGVIFIQTITTYMHAHIHTQAQPFMQGLTISPHMVCVIIYFVFCPFVGILISIMKVLISYSNTTKDFKFLYFNIISLIGIVSVYEF